MTAYEICTFELPWPRGRGDGMAAMSHDRPPVDIATYRPQIHPALAKAIHACIEPDVNKRCPTIDAFLRMVRNIPESGDR